MFYWAITVGSESEVSGASYGALTSDRIGQLVEDCQLRIGTQ